MKLLATFAIAVAMTSVACSGSGSPDGGTSVSSEAPVSSPSPEARGITLPDDLTVRNDAFGRSARRVAQAIEDLKAVSLWRPLTKRLYVVKFGSRLGRTNIPDDGHLADAFLTVQIDGAFGGPLCDVRFYPTAMKDDLERWQLYHEQGLLAEPPPSLRRFWASIMAHELAHCLDGPNGERVAHRWEDRALEAIRRAGLP